MQLDQSLTETFQAYISAANRYVTELDSIAEEVSTEQPGTAEMLRAFAKWKSLACTRPDRDLAD